MIPKSQHNDSFAGQEFRPRSIALSALNGDLI